MKKTSFRVGDIVIPRKGHPLRWTSEILTRYPLGEIIEVNRQTVHVRWIYPTIVYRMPSVLVKSYVSVEFIRLATTREILQYTLGEL